MKEYVLLGGGGLALEIAEYMLAEGYSIRGYCSPQEDEVCSALIPYIGDEREKCLKDAYYIIAVGMIALRNKLIGFLRENDLYIGDFISSRAYVSSLASIGNGAVILPFSVISGNPQIGDFLLANYFSNIAHHAKVGNNVVLNPGARINGNCSVGNNVTLGSNSSLIQGTCLENDVEVGILTYPKKVVKGKQMVLAPSGKLLSLT